MHTVVREPQYEEEFKTITKDYDINKIEDLESAIDWALSRNPYYFTNIVNDYFVWRSQQFSEFIPQLTILYKVNKNEVILLSVKVSE